jgi:hypothetical protein
MPMKSEFLEITRENKLRFNFHLGQWKAWQSKAEITAIISGTQSGKTVFGPPWLYREIQAKGPGDYMVVTPTFPLLQLKALPAFKYLFETTLGLGKYKQSPIKHFTFSEYGQEQAFGAHGMDYQTTVFFGHAMDPDSLEAATIKGLWADEAGQPKFKLDSWQALERRCAIHEARKLITTTPYNLGWLKTEIFDKEETDPDIKVINFRSIDNPVFPRKKYDEARDKLPAWKFLMFYKGIFTKPAGLIYDIYDDTLGEYGAKGIHKIKAFDVPLEWPRMVGIDPFGAFIAAVWLAFDPQSQKLVAYREYRGEFGKTTPEHAAEILKLSQSEPVFVWAGGGPSERQARADFAGAGIPLQEPGVVEVWAGIDRVYQLLKSFDLAIMDNCPYLLSELGSYQRVMDGDEPTDKIEDKEKFNQLDALRYIIAYMTRGEGFSQYTYDPVQIGRGW